jgi:hypothetical protein
LLRGSADNEPASPIDSVVAMTMMDFVAFMILVVLWLVARPFGFGDLFA